MSTIKNNKYTMKKKSLLFLSTALFFVAIFTACKKEDKSSSNDNSTEASVHSDDQARFSSEVDAVANDADGSLESSASFSGRLDQAHLNVVCDATLEYDTISNPRTITITYNGGNCWGTRIRTGVVVLSMAQGVHWKDAGAVLTVTFQNLKITRASDSKSITINGTQTYTNVSGGLLINLLLLGTITHTITSSDMSVTFDDNTQRTWQVAKQRVYAISNNVGTITITGTHTEGNITNVAEWGTNRFGHAFTSSTVQPLVISSDCNFRLISGEVKHITPLVTATVTFGLNADGNPTSCPGTGHYYFKVVWTGSNGNSLTLIMPY
jgi:hypothetical protein